MKITKAWILAGTALAGLVISQQAVAQSTGTQATEEGKEVKEVVVRGNRAKSVSGAMIAETVSKARTTITDEFISTQPAGQTVFESLNLVPGLNFTNTDAFGSSGGSINVRGLDGARVGFTLDGAPLNDSGNYAIFSNQQLDPELIERAQVNLGSTDVDSPTASAAGGTVSYTTKRPLKERGFEIVATAGDERFGRVYVRADSGKFGPFDTTGFLTYSKTGYDHWRGSGTIAKQQWNGRLFQDLGEGNFASLSFNWNRNRNNFYRNMSKAQFDLDRTFANDQTCNRPTAVAGTVQNDGTQSIVTTYNGTTLNNTSCTNFTGLRINPGNTGSIRGQLRYAFSPSLRLTVDPSFQYVLANGGGFTNVSEGDGRLRGSSTALGRDLNGDGDILDTVSLFTPNNTNTRRFGLTTSLIWEINDSNRIRAAYTLDYAHHRQTGEASFLSQQGQPATVFAGKDGWGPKVVSADGTSFLRVRDRFSEANLNQFALEYRGIFFEGDVTANIGVRAPFFERNLNQYCLTQNLSASVLCTNQVTTASPSLNGTVRVATATTNYIPPFKKTFKYDKVLPNLGVNWRINGSRHSVYAGYAENLSAPRTDNLYAAGVLPAPVGTTTAIPLNIRFLDFLEPETSQVLDLGYRYQSPKLNASLGVYNSDFQNRIESSFDQDLNANVDRNIGSIKIKGIEGQFDWQVLDTVSLYASFAYTDAKLEDDIRTGLTTTIATKGKRLTNTPEEQYAVRASWDVTKDFAVALQGKYVGPRFSTDLNDEKIAEYVKFDLDARLALNIPGTRESYLQLNVLNLSDEKFINNIGTGRSGPQSGHVPIYPRTATISLTTKF
jgi:iron complex outermembrane recepter protein